MKKLEAKITEVPVSSPYIVRSPFRPSKVSTLSDPFPFKPQDSQHSFSSLHSTGKLMPSGKKKTKQTAKETMQAKMIGKIPLRNETKVKSEKQRGKRVPFSRLT